jgi:pimeloyl-ACP methyl ester carboxylesterase
MTQQWSPKIYQTKTVLLIHGAGSIGAEWINFKNQLTELGFKVIIPTLRHHQIEGVNPKVGDLSLNDYIFDLKNLIASLTEKPIIIGHSMGGLLALKLCALNLAKMGILITPAAPKGINAISFSVLRIFILNIFRWKFWKRPVPPRYKSARYGVLHDLSENRAKEVFKLSNSAESGRALCEIGFPFFFKNCPTEINFSKYFCKTLLIGCGRDRITPISIARKLQHLIGKNCEYKEFSNFSHYIMEGDEFTGIFKECVGWIQKNQSVKT